MPQILVRNVKVRTYRRLKKQAASGGRSLQSEVNTILDEAAQPEPRTLNQKEFVAMLDGFRKRWKGKTFSDSTVLVREDRDNR